MTLRPRIAVTMGDPAGVGPELVPPPPRRPGGASRLPPGRLRRRGPPPPRRADAGRANSFSPSRGTFFLPLSEGGFLPRTPPPRGGEKREEGNHEQHLDALPILSRSEWPVRWAAIDGPAILDLECVTADSVQPGVVAAACGRAAYDCFTFAIDEALAGRVDAVATAPLHKEALHAAGFPFPGHTEILAGTHSRRAVVHDAHVRADHVQPGDGPRRLRRGAGAAHGTGASSTRSS